MFGFFKSKLSLVDYAKNSEITPVAEDGDIAGFIVQINDNGRNFAASAKDRDEILNFIQIIDRRIQNREFENIFKEVDEMLRGAGMEVREKNLNAQRVVVCKNESVFRWVPGE